VTERIKRTWRAWRGVEQRYPTEWAYSQACRAIEKHRERADTLQAAVDLAHSTLRGTQYVGGPTEREAYRIIDEALGSVATQHIGARR
jgi:hypothetical protein